MRKEKGYCRWCGHQSEGSGWLAQINIEMWMTPYKAHPHLWLQMKYIPSSDYAAIIAPWGALGDGRMLYKTISMDNPAKAFEQAWVLARQAMIEMFERIGEGLYPISITKVDSKAVWQAFPSETSDYVRFGDLGLDANFVFPKTSHFYEEGHLHKKVGLNCSYRVDQDGLPGSVWSCNESVVVVA